jgi:hypothetical protein
VPITTPLQRSTQTIMRLGKDWPWAGQLATAFERLQALPALTS